jgi:phage terminase large subunit-like protein
MTQINASLHPAQKTIHRSTARFKVIDAGRRFGKTRLGVLECLGSAAGGGIAWWVAPSYKISEVGWRPLRKLAARIPGAEVRLSDRTVILPGGGSVSIRSADSPDSLRGEGLDLVVLDEAAFMKSEAWSEALRPALSDRQGKAIFISTPRGRNWFWDIFRRGQAEGGEWQSFQYPTSSNPFIDPGEIEAARLDLPEVTFRQEYEAEFVDSEGAVFRRVQDAAILDPLEAPLPGRTYTAGVDVASSIDYTVITILDCESRDMVYMDRFTRVDYPTLEDRLEAVHTAWKLSGMVVEANGIGRPVIDHLIQRGIQITPFTTTNATKQGIIQALQSALEHGNIRILNNPVLVGELLSFESNRSPSGSYAYSAPDGMHDDTVMSLAIAYYGATGGGLWLMS